MATLSGTTLTNCFYIPDFIPAGTKTAFENTDPPTAPTSWVKDTSLTNCTLRVVTGSVTSSLLNQQFSTVLTNRTIPLTVTSVQSGLAVQSGPFNVSIAPADSTDNLSVPSAALYGVPSSHQHTVPGASTTNLRATIGPAVVVQSQQFTGATGGGVPHTHGSTATGGIPHTHQSVGHTHPVTESPHNHTSSATQNFSVNYKDLIIATKQ
jgi:hypothetical protein